MLTALNVKICQAARCIRKLKLILNIPARTDQHFLSFTILLVHSDVTGLDRFWKSVQSNPFTFASSSGNPEYDLYMNLVVVLCVALSSAGTVMEVTWSTFTLTSKAETAAFASAPVTVLDD